MSAVASSPADHTNDTPQRKSRGPYAKGIKRRQQILDRTLDVVAERGMDATSLRAIGESIGVSHGVLTNYFDSREKLLLEVVRQHDERVQDAIESPPLFDALVQAAHLNIEAPGFVTLYTTLLGASVDSKNEAAAQFFTERLTQARDGLIEAIRDDDSLVTPPETELRQIAALIVGAFDGLQVQWLLGVEPDIAGTLLLLKRLLDPHPPSEPRSGD